MNPPRPYFQFGIEDIARAVDQNKTSEQLLQLLLHELAFRSTAKAQQLAARVERLLKQVKTMPRPESEEVVAPSTVVEVTNPRPVSLAEQIPPQRVRNIPPLDLPAYDSSVGAGSPEQTEKANILKYWRAVELFMPQSLPKIDPHAKEPVYSVIPKFASPWTETHEHARKSPPHDCQWRYIVYIGSFDTGLISTKLEEAFGRDPEAFDEWQNGKAGLLSITLTHKARPLLDTFVLSSGAWSLGRLNKPGPNQLGWLDGFETVQEHLRKYLEEVYSIDSSDEEGKKLREQGFTVGSPALAASLFQVLDRMAAFLNLQELPIERCLRVRCVPVSYKKIYSTDDQDSLNSFFVRDLGRISRAVAAGIISAPLSAYLTSDKFLRSADRLDVCKADPLSLCWNKLKPSRFPSAKWPAPNHHPLVYSQQIAVNELTQELAREGLFAINGPPGTGKTTLLRDIISKLITTRAEALAKLPSPAAGFSGSSGWKSGQFRRRVNLPVDSLLGFEMVVASANNGAVENVTLELPSLESVDSNWRAGLNYFPDIAAQLLGRPAWGLIAARLGNKGNRRDFLNRFWFGSDEQSGFRQFLEKAEETNDTVDWKKAVSNFEKAVQAERQIRNSRENAWNALLQFNIHTKRKGELEPVLSNLKERYAAEEAAVRVQDRHVKECAASVGQTKSRRMEHLSFRPTLWQTIITWGRAYREWSQEDSILKAAITGAELGWTAVNDRLQSMKSDLRTSQQIRDQKEQELVLLDLGIAAFQSTITGAQQELGNFFVAGQEWQDDESLREQSSPWANESWNLAREQVFISALQLHKAFVLANAKLFRQNLNALADVLGGNLTSDAPEAGVIGAWNTLFLLIPVISTTFASIDRLLPFHGAASIGWLFIDEAGQATPEAAVGALWRTRRAVVVGDPLQLEPIISLPFTAQDALKRHFLVSNGWRPGEISCQGLADRVNRLGTFIPTQDDPLWVGSPLRVHRRCEEPMFTISNKVAYEGAMVFGTLNRQDFVNLPSTWFHVQSNEADSHWIPQEGKVVMDLLEYLSQADIKPEQIFLISPFRSVACQLRNNTMEYKGIRSGTIHSVQGKEADIVIFVLGGHPARPGAKDWAAAKPNLVNVAVSRARRRIYVVGNRVEWSQRNFFKTLAHSLPIISV